MNSIFVTGSSGFIGKKIVERLPQEQVLTDFVNSTRINLQNINEVLDIKPAETVIHLAAKIPKKESAWQDYFQNNITTTTNILEYCRIKNVKNLIYVSSYVYGNPKYSPIDENHPIDPHNAYNESKYLGERLCKFYSDKTNLNVTILRSFNIFGESMNQGFLLANLIESAKTGKRVLIVNKNSKRDFLYVDDFVDLILKIINHDWKFEIFNIGTGMSFSFEDIINKIEDITAKKLNLDYTEDKNTAINEIKADITKIQEKTNWKPKIKFEEGLRKMLRV
ncbi:NAD-dependent epimerase/dehydratase family protein [Nitrosopumilus sp. S6]